MGRLSVYEKQHPVPLFLAAERAAKSTVRKFAIAMAGWFSDKNQEKLHRDAAAALAPSVPAHFPDGKDPDVRVGIWSAADIFVLAVDNIQETFGLAPVEAMAAGLPVVCSDWNGFRDTVEHGVTGLRIRTRMSPPGSGSELAVRFEDGHDQYLQYLSFVQQRTMIDVREMADAIAALAAAPDKRRAMGEAGVERARRLYDWAAIVPQYQALWAEQARHRARGVPTTHREADEPPNPAAIDPFTLYRGYPSDRLTLAAVIYADAPVSQAAIERLMDLTGATQIRRYVTSAANLARIHAAVVAEGPLMLDALIALVGLDANLVTAGVLWLAKYDLVRIDE